MCWLLGWARRLLLLSVLLLAAPGAYAKDDILDYYEDEQKAVPVLVFCSSEPEVVGHQLIRRTNVEYLPLDDVAANEKRLPEVAPVFLIARSDTPVLPEALLKAIPKLREADPNEVFVYSEMGPRAPRRRTAYPRLVVSAPTRWWLTQAIEALKSYPDFPHTFPNSRYLWRREIPNPLVVAQPVEITVADACRALAAPDEGRRLPNGEEIRNALVRTQYRVPVRFLTTPAQFEGYRPWLPYADEVFLLTHDEVGRLPAAVKERLPAEAAGLKLTEMLRVSKPRGGHTATCFVAPSLDLMRGLFLAESARSVGPEPEVREVPDLRQVKTVVVSGGADLAGGAAGLTDLIEGLVADSVSQARLFRGVRCGSRGNAQMKAVLEALKPEMQGLAEKDREDLRVLANADMLLMLQVTRAAGKVSYRIERTQVTPDEPPFQFRKEPTKPNPEDRKGFLEGHKYSDVNGSRADDPHYKEDLAAWEKERAKWERERDKAKREYEDLLRRKQFEWKWQILSEGEAHVEATVRLYDIETGAVIWSTPILRGAAQESKVVKEQTLVVTGQGSKPEDPEPSPAPRAAAPPDLMNRAAKEAASKFIPALRQAALLPEPARPGRVWATVCPESGALVNEGFCPKAEDRDFPEADEPKTKCVLHGPVAVEVCAESGRRATAWCPRKERREFRTGAQPAEECALPEHQPEKVEVCKASGLLARRPCPERDIRTFRKGEGPKEYCREHQVTIKDPAGLILTVANGVVTAEKVGKPTLVVGDTVTAVVRTQEIRRRDGTVLDVKDDESVPLKVVTVLENSFECTLVNPEDAAKLEPDLPIRSSRPPAPGKDVPRGLRQAPKASPKPPSKKPAPRKPPAKRG